MSSMSAVRELQRRYEGGGTKHEIIDNDDYIANPKPDGYRSLHLVLKYRGDVEETAGNRLVVEVQIRTGLQHAWATAVEAVGLVRRENLKSGEGSADWLRLFQLMAGEIAVAENCALPATVPSDRAVRRAELKALDKKLGAVKSLEGYNAAIRHAENYTNISGYSYLIKYNIDNQTVSVEPFSQFRRAAAQYFEREQSSSSARENIVFVEVDGVDELKAAYPSYFLDVRLFTEQLKAAVFENVPFVDRLSPRRPQPPDKPPRKRKWGDLSFLRDYRLK